MSKFNEYAQRLNQAVLDYRTEYFGAEERVKAADQAYREFKENSFVPGVNFSESVTKRAKREATENLLKAELDEAKSDFKRTRQNGWNVLNQCAKIRGELATALTENYYADPSQLDNNVLRLIDSGICTAQDLKKLADDASASGNHTMLRLIGEKAKEVLGENQRRYGVSHPDHMVLTNIIDGASKADGRNYLEQFDALSSIATYACGNPELLREGNPAMLTQWESLTEEAVESF